MGILNVTPDSFSDGGRFATVDKALLRAEQMLEEGASIIDVGGESTRPGALPVSIQQELDRVIPVIDAITRRLDIIVSVDTSKPEVMLEAASVGAAMINDVHALQQPGALQAAASVSLPVCLMHMQGSPETMQCQPEYDDVVNEVLAFLDRRVQQCLAAGMTREALIVDPGFGFGKTVAHNFRLLQQLHRIQELGFPVLVGLSRKSMLGAVIENESVDRLYASVSAAIISAMRGAAIVRVHDVGPTREALSVLWATQQA